MTALSYYEMTGMHRTPRVEDYRDEVFALAMAAAPRPFDRLYRTPDGVLAIDLKRKVAAEVRFGPGKDVLYGHMPHDAPPPAEAVTALLARLALRREAADRPQPEL